MRARGSSAGPPLTTDVWCQPVVEVDELASDERDWRSQAARVTAEPGDFLQRLAVLGPAVSRRGGRQQHALPDGDGGLRASPGKRPLDPRYRPVAAPLVRSWCQSWSGMVAVSMTKR